MLPFLIEDETSRAQRIPGGFSTEHPNGATGISRLLIATPWNVAEVHRTLTVLVDTSPQDWYGVTVALGPQEIHVLSTVPDPSQSFGGPLAIELRTAGRERTELDTALAQGVRIRLNWA